MEGYGDIGEGFIECHHLLPLSQIRPNQVTKLSDLATVCANCHRMLHRGGYALSLEKLRECLLPKAGITADEVPA